MSDRLYPKPAKALSSRTKPPIAIAVAQGGGGRIRDRRSKPSGT
jgi:hypothetical protein